MSRLRPAVSLTSRTWPVPAPGVDQAMSVVASMQQGVRSRGFDGAYLCRQERCIQFLHENIDRYLRAEADRHDRSARV